MFGGLIKQTGEGGAEFAEGNFDRAVGELRKGFVQGDGNERIVRRRLHQQFRAQIHRQGGDDG